MPIKIFSGQKKGSEDLEKEVNKFEKDVQEKGGEMVSSQGLQKTKFEWVYDDSQGTDQYYPVTHIFYDILILYKLKK